ncbi:MAG: TraB/GumN family protein [Parvibaculum sp.]|uniref:TraB/GumN family protein n=1 Tax=Parvibaculum sp. TaxID=2024848 RepID=UPI002731C2D9|nr:TraB/GumN family protein [Parvibaculum sp.]MDP2151350.1 TraB/GumN family protein [Parvibaculum sp.]
MTTIGGMLAAVTSAATLLLSPAAAWAEPAVWTVRDEDSTIVLFGSVHLLPDGLDWRPAALDAALDAADDLWFETPTEGGEGRMATRALGMLPVGESLHEKLSAEGRARLERVSDAVSLSPAALDALRPWLADVTLSVAMLIRDGARAEAGVEAVLASAAPGAGRRYFETPWEQVAFLAEAPEADQLASLEETLRQLDEDPELFARLVRAWLAGDQAAIDALGVAPLRTLSPGLYERLLAGRNRRWTERIVERLAGSGTTVIVVGAGHLTGPDGVPALLRARGVAVEGP